ncbi:MAG: hypothetical protein H7A37_02215 [Chlamydiales bacterium]|nr:hypothetical protein [Chlamydiales bacterium]
MTSLKQIEANRKNARRSTGPISMDGKAVVARNAVKHGILSTRTFVEEEEQEIYEDFCERLFENLNPCGSFENFLVDRIISTAWRLRRVVHIEALLFQKAKDFLYNDSYCEAFVGSSSTSMATLSRYERALECSFYRAIRELKEFRGQEEVEILAASFRG